MPFEFVAEKAFHPSDDVRTTLTHKEDQKEVWEVNLKGKNPDHDCNLSYVIQRDGRNFYQEDFYILPNQNGINIDAQKEDLAKALEQTFIGKVRFAKNIVTTPDLIVQKPGLQSGEVRFHFRQKFSNRDATRIAVNPI